MFERISGGGIDYLPYRLENSRLRFRGPEPDLSGPYCAFVGSSETYGKFVERPYPDLLGGSLGMPCVNFGCVNAGVDVFLNDTALQETCARARVTVVAVMGAHNLSNRFYAVHPRRNDRFIRASALLKGLYPEVDFTQFHFSRHMLSALKECSPALFPAVVQEVQIAWVARMRRLLQGVRSKTILLHLAESAGEGADTPFGPEPLFVTREMIDELRPAVSAVVECSPPPACPGARTAGMVFDELEESAARGMPSPATHGALAKALIGPLRELAL